MANTAIRGKHGASAEDHPFHLTWVSWTRAHRRCYTPSANAFHRYGGRGIIVCPEWARFETFLQDMGPRPLGKTLDRINPDGPYSKENCRWATHHEQCEHRNTDVRLIYRGREMNMAHIAR